MRMKARSIGILCEDYITDKVVNVDIFEKSNEVFDGTDPALIDRIYSSKEGIDIGEFPFKDIIHPNECFILKSDRNSVLARYNPFSHTVCRVNKSKNYGIEPRNAEQSFAFEVLNDPNIKLVGLTGKAGTGKTLLALAAALHQMNEYKQILLARPIVALSNKDIGFLPGDEQEKISPLLRPVMSLKAVVTHVKWLQPGQSVSYGRTFQADHCMKIATVTVGYADGYSRLLSSKADVLVKGRRCPIVGRICMDQLMLDVSAIDDLRCGEIVTLIGQDGDEQITADELASLYGTIGYEVVCGISKRVPRIYVD